MTPLRQRMIEDMQLRGLSALTQRAYLRAVRELARYYGKAPDRITEEELRQYFLYLHHQKRLARSTTIVNLCGIKFFFEHTLRTPWPSIELLRPRSVHKLPVVLSAPEVWHILGRLHLPAYRACLSTIYTCGLRLHEEGRHGFARNGPHRRGSMQRRPSWTDHRCIVIDRLWDNIQIQRVGAETLKRFRTVGVQGCYGLCGH